MAKYEDIKKANESIRTTNIKGKEYAEVNQRIKAFRMVYPEGAIVTTLLSNENGVCVFKASVFADSESCMPLGVGHAYEKESSSFINKTSYIENCETSAVGRALGMAGFGIDTSVCSAEELTNALNNQQAEPTRAELMAKIEALMETKGVPIEEILKMAKVEDLGEMTIYRLGKLVEWLGEQ